MSTPPVTTQIVSVSLGAKVMLTSGGSDSVDLACKLARRHWQLEGRPEKLTILSRHGAYHGLHAFGTSVAGLPYNREGYGSESLVPETALISTNDIDEVRAQVAAIGAKNIAAVIVEPVIGTGGVIGPAAGYLEGLAALARDHDILLIADEVITGFGRTGQMFASQRYGIRPDLVTVAKGLTSGYAALGLVEQVSGEAVAEACTDAGVLIRTIHANTLQVCPPFVTTEDEIALIAATITTALDETRAGERADA